MNVIGQDDHRINRERVAVPSCANCLAQGIDLVDEKRRPTTLEQVHRKEPAPTGYQGSTIVRHDASLADIGGLRFANPPYSVARIR
jgi:hypothetical protein